MTAVNAADTPPQIERDRRVNTRVRKVFDEALLLVAPFFDREQIWGGVTLDYFAHRVLRDHFPDLTMTDIYLFVAAAKNVYADKHSASGKWEEPFAQESVYGTIRENSSLESKKKGGDISGNLQPSSPRSALP